MFMYPHRGNTVPQILVEKAEEYLPPDMGFLIKFVEVNLQLSSLFLIRMSCVKLGFNV